MTDQPTQAQIFLSDLSTQSTRTGNASGQESRPRPSVTLTFAQTIDGCIAGVNGRQLILSGEESMRMTHELRTMHDGILVGVGTVINDDPRLIARLVPNVPPVQDQPRPIILDTHLRTPPTCRLLANHASGSGRQPLILTTETNTSTPKFSALASAGAEILTLPDLSWSTILEALSSQAHVTRLMVEGGASVIESLLTEAEGGMIDSLIVTVSPRFAGSDGFKYKSLSWFGEIQDKRGTQEVPWQVKKREWFGLDAVWWWVRKS